MVYHKAMILHLKTLLDLTRKIEKLRRYKNQAFTYREKQFYKRMELDYQYQKLDLLKICFNNKNKLLINKF